jgi:hypothetical protein
MVMKGITMVPLLFTSITTDRYQVFLESPLKAFLYNDVVAVSILRNYIQAVVSGIFWLTVYKLF